MNRFAALLPPLALLVLAAFAYAPPVPPSDPRPLAPADSEWTWPERGENLQVLPDDVGAENLRAVMVGFTRALGVRCSFCHVGEGDFLNWDFASDANPHKDVARVMMRMTEEINTEELASIEAVDAEAGPAGWGVTCWTCHRGSTHPETRMPDPDAPPAPPDTSGGHGETHRHRDGSEHRHDD